MSLPTLPDWFELRVGFSWLDDDGDVCVLLGWEPEAFMKGEPISVSIGGIHHVGMTYEHGPRMTYAAWYHNTWTMLDLREASRIDRWSPLPCDHAHLTALMSGDTNKHCRY